MINKIRGLLLIPLIASAASLTTFASTGGVTPLMAAPVFTEDELHDILELLRFVRSAKPDLYEEFSYAFMAVGHSCSRGRLDEAQASELALIIEQIENALPRTNSQLLSKIRLAMTFGGKKYYRPQFRQTAHVRANISKFMTALFNAYVEQDFLTCTELITYAADDDGAFFKENLSALKL